LHPLVDAYLDIETTGLSPRYCEITVVGIHLVSRYESRFIQFDLPFIYIRLGINLAKLYNHCR
jgi:hypothetical protein